MPSVALALGLLKIMVEGLLIRRIEFFSALTHVARLIYKPRMLGTLCRIAERCDAGPAGKNTLALHRDLNTNDSIAVIFNMPVRLSIQLGSRQQLRCYAKSIRTTQAAELPTASAVLSIRATICIPQLATPSAQ